MIHLENFMNKEDENPPELKFIDLRNTPEGYEPHIEYDKNGVPTSYIYCPMMPVNVEEVRAWWDNKRKNKA